MRRASLNPGGAERVRRPRHTRGFVTDPARLPTDPTAGERARAIRERNVDEHIITDPTDVRASARGSAELPRDCTGPQPTSGPRRRSRSALARA